MIKPVQARTDEKKVTELLQILTAISHQRFPRVDLERFGLDQPNVQLYLDDEYFGFGGFAPTLQRQYVMTGDHVYLISPRYVLALPSSAGITLLQQSANQSRSHIAATNECNSHINLIIILI